MELSVNKLSDIVDNGLCVGCGICQSIAGSDKIISKKLTEWRNAQTKLVDEKPTEDE